MLALLTGEHAIGWDACLGLSSGTSYAVHVWAMNGLGYSDDPAHADFNTIAVTTPSPPRDKAFSSITTSSAYITWSPPLSDGNSPITGYQIALSYLLGCVAALSFSSPCRFPSFHYCRPD